MMRGPLSVRIALREAVATTVSRPWRLLVFTIVAGALISAPAILEVATTNSLLALLRAEEARGANVLIVESRSGALDGGRCQAIAAQDGVENAGAVSTPEVVSVGTPALTSARSIRATPGYFRIMGYVAPRDNGGPRVLIGHDLAREASIADGAPLVLSGSSPLLAENAPKTVREESRGRWIMIPVPELVDASQCWIEASGTALSAVRAAIPTYFPDTREIQVSSLVSMSASSQAIDSWMHRPTRWLFTACGLLTGLVCGVLMWARRSEFALYRILGLTRVVVFLLAAVESALLLVPALVLAGIAASAVSTTWRGAAPTDLVSTLLLQLSLTAAVAILTAGVACIPLTSGNSAHVLRNRE